MNMRKELLIRAYLVMLSLVVIAGVLATSTVKIAIIEGADWRDRGDSTKLRYFDLEAERGTIYSADGHMLATSVPHFDLYMDLNTEAMTDAIFQRHVDSLAIQLARHVFHGHSAADVKKKLIKRRQQGDRYFPIKKNASYDELEVIKSFPLIRLGKYRGGLIVEPMTTRMKPFRYLAARTIGLQRTHAPSVGLEASYDQYLRGEAGKRLMQRVGQLWIPVHDLTEIAPRQGLDVHTTLDMRMQDICHSTLEKTLEYHDADYGIVIMMEVQTGAVRAIVNLDKQNDGSYREVVNHAIVDLLEPGSTFKLASMMALLEDKFVSLDDSVRIDHGRATYGRFQMRDSEWNSEEQISVRRSFEISSNVGIARLVDRAYGTERKGAQFVKRLRQFGLAEPSQIDLDGEPRPVIKDANAENWNHIMTLPWMAHGYELQLTPLQTLTFYNAVANGGKKMKPYLVERVADGVGVVKTFKPTVVDNKIASSKTIALAHELLEGVVEAGTASSFKPSQYKIAGKTGTAKFDYWKGETNKYQASFAGYFPADNPKYSCIVVVSNPRRHGYYGSTVAGRAFRQIADKCMASDRALIAATGPVAYGLDPREWPLFQVGYATDMRKLMKHTRLPFRDDSSAEWVISMPDEASISIQDRAVPEGVVPNVVGMSIKDALYLLENAGLSVRISGYGRVREQSLPAGTPLTGQKIWLSLS